MVLFNRPPTTEKPKAIRHPKTVAAAKKSVTHRVTDGAYTGWVAAEGTAAVGLIGGPFDLAATTIAEVGGDVTGFVVWMSDR